MRPSLVLSGATLIGSLCRGAGLRANLPGLAPMLRSLLGGGDDAAIEQRILEAFALMPDSKQKLVLALALNLTSLGGAKLEDRRRQAERLVGLSSRTVTRYQKEAELQLAVLLIEYEGSEPLMWIDVDEDGVYTLGERPDWVDPRVFALRRMA